MADPQRINRNQYSWSSIIFKLAEERFTGFTSISFGDKRERVKAYGMGRHHAPRGRSAGKYSVDPVKVVGWKSSVQALREALAKLSPDGKSYGDVEFQGLVQYVEADESEVTVELDRLVWASNTTSDEEAPDPLKEEFELDCMLIRRNGLYLFDGSGGQP